MSYDCSDFFFFFFLLFCFVSCLTWKSKLITNNIFNRRIGSLTTSHARTSEERMYLWVNAMVKTDSLRWSFLVKIGQHPIPVFFARELRIVCNLN